MSLVNRIIKQEVLTEAEAAQLMADIIEGKLAESQVAAVLTSYQFRPVTAVELSGFKQSILANAVKPEISFSKPLLDVCGTGGDGKDTFNVSTLTALLVASTGQAVAKHGNYASSSMCGSSNVLEAVGVKLSGDSQYLQSCLEEAGICFLHAPLFHPALKNVAGVRKELGFRTIFNLLGPLVNPLNPQYQYTGVCNMEVLKLYVKVLRAEGKKFAVNYSYDGYDEISLTSRFAVFIDKMDAEYLPEGLNIPRASAEDLKGGDSIEAAAKIFMKIAKGNGTDIQNAVVATNAAFALSLVNDSKNQKQAVQENYQELIAQLKLGAIAEILERLAKISV